MRLVIECDNYAELTALSDPATIRGVVEKEETMRTTRRPAPRFFGLPLGPDERAVVLNDRELATLRRAIGIREVARERLEAEWGTERFEASDEFTLSVDDLLEDGGVAWSVETDGWPF